MRSTKPFGTEPYLHPLSSTGVGPGDDAWTMQIGSPPPTGPIWMEKISMGSHVPEAPKKKVSLVLASLPSQTWAGQVLANVALVPETAIKDTIQSNLFIATPSNALPLSGGRTFAADHPLQRLGQLTRDTGDGIMACSSPHRTSLRTNPRANRCRWQAPPRPQALDLSASGW